MPIGALEILRRQLGAGFCLEIGPEQREILLGQGAAMGGHLFELGELAQPDGGHDVGHVEFAAEHVHIQSVDAVAGHALQTVFLGQQRFLGIIEHQAAAFAGGDVLVGLEAERDQIAEGADAAAAPARTDRLRRIFHDAQVMTSSPGPMPAMRRAISMVHVPELKVRTGRPPK